MHNRRVDLWRNLCTSLLYSVVRVRNRRKKSSRSLSHLLMSFLLFIATDLRVRFDFPIAPSINFRDMNGDPKLGAQNPHYGSPYVQSA